MWPDPEDALSHQEREYDADDREREQEDAARHEPPAKYFVEIFNERGAMVKRLPCDTILAATAVAKAESGIHSGHAIVRGAFGALIFDTRNTAPAPPAGDLFSGSKGAPR